MIDTDEKKDLEQIVNTTLKEISSIEAIYLFGPEKSAKACLSLLDILITDEHLYTTYLVKFVILESKDLNKDFMRLLPDVNKLESYYIPARYGVDRFGKIHYMKKKLETFAVQLWIS